MKIGPLVILEPTAADEVYVPCFRGAIELLRPTTTILREGGVLDGTFNAGTEEWDETAKKLRDGQDVLAVHLQRVQDAHNTLVDVWPRKSLRRSHRLLVASFKAYGWALADDIRYTDAILNGLEEDMRRHKRNALQWDKIAADYASKLVTELTRIRSLDTSLFSALVGETDLEELRDTAERSPIMSDWGRFV